MPTKLSIGGNIGVPVGPGSKVGVSVNAGIGVGVEVGVSVAVDLAVRVRSAAGTNFVGAFAVAVGMPLCVSAKTVLTVERAVCMISASLIVGVDWPPLQDASRAAARNKGTNRVLPRTFI
jgi:hypothetical protein